MQRDEIQHCVKLEEMKTSTFELALLIAGMRGEVRSEWDEAKQHDVLFLMTIRPPDALAMQRLRAAAQVGFVA